MNKVIRFMSLIVFALVCGFAVSTAASMEIVSADTLVRGVPSETQKSHAHVVNNSGASKTIAVKITPIAMTEKHTYSICVPGVCLPPATTEITTPEFVVEDKQDIYNDFYLALTPYYLDEEDNMIEVEGESSFKVEFINVNDAQDKSSYSVRFVISTAGIVSETWTKDAEVFPNPVSDFLTIKLENTAKLNSTLRVMSSNSTVVMEQTINTESELIRLNTNGLNSGNYYFSLESDGKVTNSGSFVVVK